MKLQSLLLLTAISFSIPSFAVQNEPGPKLPENHIDCHSAEEFEKSVEYLRSEKILGLNDKQIVTWSLVIAKGCSGATARFKNVFDLLMKTGVDFRKTVELASSFSKKTDEQTHSFAGLFKTFFLENYFDLDFMTAYELSLKLSENPAKSEFARRDFEKLYKFCTGQDKLMLPFKSCAKYSLNLLKHYELYPEGIFPFFESTINFLTTRTGAVLNIKEALEITEDILAHGPLAPETFKRGYNYAVNKKGLDTSAKQGMRIALELAKISLKEISKDNDPNSQSDRGIIVAEKPGQIETAKIEEPQKSQKTQKVENAEKVRKPEIQSVPDQEKQEDPANKQ